MKTGRIIQSTGKWYKVSCDGEIIDSRLPGKFRLDKKEVTNPIAVGDYVDLEIGKDGTGSIQKIHERKNYLTRQATHGRRGAQILVSNVDRAWVVQSIRQPKLNLGFIDRFLVTCEAYEVPGGIIINKMDLANKKDQEYVADVARLYRSLGYKVAVTSAETGEFDDLNDEIAQKTSVFIGPSGVGKTTILNQIEPGLDLRVGNISSYSQKGKHTTTYAQLVPLTQGGYIVDTPGIREFGLFQIEKAELSLFFPEMTEPRNHCKFYNCTHYHEPECGVVEAFEEGDIAASRYQSYINILESLEEPSH